MNVETDGTKQRIELLLTELRSSIQAQVLQASEIVQADGGNVFPFDQLALAAINRSLSLIEGATLLVEHRNPLCAIPLLRLQLDSVLRLFACTLVDDPHVKVLKILAGEKLSSFHVRRARLKAPENAKGKGLTVALSDSLLHRELSLIDPWATRVYERTSGYIHLSDAHIFNISKISSEKRTISIQIGCPPDMNWSEELIVEYLEAFIAITRRMLWLAGSWAIQKDQAGKVRKQKALDGDPAALRIEQMFAKNPT
jgi:hypothetical protein